MSLDTLFLSQLDGGVDALLEALVQVQKGLVQIESAVDAESGIDARTASVVTRVAAIKQKAQALSREAALLVDDKKAAEKRCLDAVLANRRSLEELSQLCGVAPPDAQTLEDVQRHFAELTDENSNAQRLKAVERLH